MKSFNKDQLKEKIKFSLLDSLVYVTRLLGKSLSREILIAGLPLKNGIIDSSLFIRATKRSGFVSKVLKRDIGDLMQLSCPVVMLLDDYNACIITQIDRKNNIALIADPSVSDGSIQVSLTELSAIYAGSVLLIRRQAHFNNKLASQMGKKKGHWFWSTLFRSMPIYRNALIASFFVNILALVSPFFVMNIYDRVVPNGAVETLWMLSIGALLAFSFDFALKQLRSHCIDVAGKKSDILLSSRIMEHVLGLKMAFKPNSIGSFSKNMQEFESIREFITSTTVITLIDIPFAFILLTGIMIVGGSVVLVPIMGIAVIITISFFIQNPLKRTIEKTYHASAQKNATLVECLAGLDSVRLCGAESQIQAMWEEYIGHIARWSSKAKTLSHLTGNVAGMVQNCVTVLIILVGVYKIIAGDISMGALIASVMLSGRAMAPVTQIASLSTRYNQAKSALAGLDTIMSLPTERVPGRTFIHLEQAQGSISIENISFRYQDQPFPTIDDVSLRIRQGEKIGIIGRIGSGKSTLAKLIAGLYQPDSGLIRIDNIDVNQIDPTDRYRVIGCIPQELNVFSGTVRHNITLGAENISDSRIIDVVQMAGVNTFTDLHPEGLDMPLVERGINLSGGQRQTIVLARALLLNPAILILDEPTSAMDTLSQTNILNMLKEKCSKKTIILVTHRSSMLELVDTLVVMDRGRIVATGAKEIVIEAIKKGKVKFTM